LSLTLEERVSHIDLSEPCIPLGYSPSKAQTCADFGVEDDLGSWREAGVHRCHVCNANSKNGWCSNPKHYFLGTPKENAIAQQSLLQLVSNDWYKPLTKPAKPAKPAKAQPDCTALIQLLKDRIAEGAIEIAQTPALSGLSYYGGVVEHLKELLQSQSTPSSRHLRSLIGLQ
jgi:hypothetical protein